MSPATAEGRGAAPGDAGRLRLFVAFGLPAETRQALADRAAVVRATLPAARWVPAANLHLTLLFLGPVEPHRVADLDAAFGPVFAASPRGRLRLREAGTFPPRRPARTAWVGAEALPVAAGGPAPDLSALVASLAAVAGASGDEGRRELAEVGAFAPHVTLARPRPPWGPKPCATFATAFEGLARLGPVPLDAGLLMASELGDGPPRYRVVSRYPLLGDAEHDRPAGQPRGPGGGSA